MLLNILITGLTFAFMEVVAWFTHKYVMHGFLWNLHRSHHKPRYGWFEWNDLFGAFFAVIAMLLIYLGIDTFNGLFWAGIGVTLYGVAYFVFHDVLVHRRLHHRIRPESHFLQKIVRAHKLHHKCTDKEGCTYFGFLFIPLFEKGYDQRENGDFQG